ncbi:MAG: HAMP domain-containing sensor histidine kinase [Gemmatimonadota bacterium]
MSSETPHPMEMGHDSEASVLETAAQRVAARLHEHFPDRPADEYERLRRRLATMVVALRRIVAGATGAAVPAFTRADEVLLARMEHELLWLPKANTDTDAVLRALRACSTYRNAPMEGGQPAASEASDLRSRMVGPDAFELLVEVAHDFRSPLTSILFLSETLRDGHSGEVNDLQRSQLGLMYSAAFGLANVATDVVDLARRGLDLVDEEPSPYGFAEVFRNVERMIRPMVEEKGLELRIEIPDRGQSEGHAHALGRVMLNLTTNAVKFTDEGLVEIGVKQLSQGRVEYYVQDTGRGIPEDRQKELFQPFKKRRGQGQTGEFFSGSGVGLSIARRLVEAMGAKLEFTTSNQDGTRFYFVLRGPGRRGE